MAKLGISLQAFAEQARLFFSAIWPTIALTVYTIGLIKVCQFITRYQEQKKIIKYMPNIVQDEITSRDEEIARLNKELEEVKSERDSLKIVARVIEERSLRTVEQVRNVLHTNVVKLITEVKHDLPSMQKSRR
jgi:hypothetical protein